jgi:long-subunit fatty acid transport protein
MLSVAAGVRMINAKNIYQGFMKNMMANPNVTGHPLAPLLPQYTNGDMVSAPQFGSDLGNAIRTAYSNTDPNIGDTLAMMTSDIEVETTQSGMAFTPIFSAQFSPNDKLDIAIKYELNTSLTLTNDTKKDYADMFKHDSSFRADMPAILAIGVGYKISDKFRTQLSFNTYFDKQANWEGREDLVDKNLWEAALGLEYDINDMFTASIGFMRGVTGVSDQYQTDLSYSNSSTTIGLGVQIKPMENLSIDLGGLYVMYDDHSVDYLSGTPYAYNMNYAKTTTTLGIGVNYKF